MAVTRTARTATAEGQSLHLHRQRVGRCRRAVSLSGSLVRRLGGRFVSRDPIGFEGSKWNLHEYVESRPETITDPSGLQSQQTCDRLIAGDGFDCDRVRQNCWNAVVRRQDKCEQSANGDEGKLEKCQQQYLRDLKFCKTVLDRCLELPGPVPKPPTAPTTSGRRPGVTQEDCYLACDEEYSTQPLQLRTCRQACLMQGSCSELFDRCFRQRTKITRDACMVAHDALCYQKMTARD